MSPFSSWLHILAVRDLDVLEALRWSRSDPLAEPARIPNLLTPDGTARLADARPSTKRTEPTPPHDVFCTAKESGTTPVPSPRNVTATRRFERFARILIREIVAVVTRSSPRASKQVGVIHTPNARGSRSFDTTCRWAPSKSRVLESRRDVELTPINPSGTVSGVEKGFPSTRRLRETGCLPDSKDTEEWMKPLLYIVSRISTGP